jgi:23S rRNA (uracil1939-C5)-methyltransferase
MPMIEITAMSFGRFGVGRLEGKAVLTPATAPGDLIEVQIVRQHKDYLEATPIRLAHPSIFRRTAPCRYLPRCGGCDWQHIEYGAQVNFKARLAAEALSRAIQVTVDPASLVEPAPLEFGYRARLRLRVGARGEVGFRQSGTQNIVAVDSCLVAVPRIQFEIARQAAIEFGARCHEIEFAADTARQVLTLWLRSPARPVEAEKARGLLDHCEGLSGVILRAGQAREVAGDPSVEVELENGLVVEVDADCFSQVNHTQNRRLVALVMELARVESGISLLDLYCGAGNFALPAARRGAQVIGVDMDRWAVACAERNQKRLKLDGARFLAMPAGAAIRFLRRAAYRPSVVILDPPRAGAADVIDEIAALRPERVIYVSCNLPALSRDLRRLTAQRYQVESVRALDFFPNTHHLEVIVRAVLT